MMNKIYKTLNLLGLTSLETRTAFSEKTRDVDDLVVWKDGMSGVIYIDSFYTGDLTYEQANYRQEKEVSLNTGAPEYERLTDAKRRLDFCRRFCVGKNLLDFGCGSGEFLNKIRPYCKSVTGVELEKGLVREIKKSGIHCFNSLSDINDKSVDLLVSFHVLEHLPDPLSTLVDLKNKVVDGGIVLFEVPHAGDFLLSHMINEEFKNFTLWSQHLILHTRESLRRMLAYVGFKEIEIIGIQRYPLSNHLYWLSKGLPGGHKSLLSVLDTPSLGDAYQDSLNRMDATDTLIAVAKV